MVQVNAVDSISMIEGDCRINTEVNEGSLVTDIQSNGLNLKGFEKTLEKQDNRDKALLTEGVCGICPICHPAYCLLVVLFN